MARPRLKLPFETNGRAIGWVALSTALLLILAGLIDAPRPGHATIAASDRGDAALYRAIDARLAHGDAYYPAVAAEHRARDYPLRPFVAVRLPTRALLVRQTGATGALVLLALLATLAGLATVVRLRPIAGSLPIWTATALLLAVSVAPLIDPVVALWPELWAGLLVMLSLACRSDRRWAASVTIGLAAVLFRELALPYLAVMALAALIDRRRSETIAWTVAGLLAIAAIAAHAAAVHAVLRPGDPVSQGWVRIGGWGFDLAMARATTPLAMLPWAVTAVAMPLALFGWAMTPGGYARRTTLMIAAWLLPFLVIGRPENSYWGLLLAPLWLTGLPLAFPALRRLFNNPWKRAD